MRSHHPSFLFITILLLFSNFAVAQSSLFEDAKDLAKMIREKQVPAFDFEKCTSPKFSARRLNVVELIKDGKKIEPLDGQDKPFNFSAPAPFRLPDFGVYVLRHKGGQQPVLSATDTLQIMVGDSLVAVVGDSLLTRVKVNFNLIKTEIFVYHFDEQDTLRGEEELIFSSESNFMEMLEILNAHVNLKSQGLRYLNYQTFENVPKKYVDNPFFDRRLQEQILLDETSAKYLRANFFDLASKPKREDDWEKLMYGDSILQFEKTISFQDVSSNYRDPITSKNELDIANSRINESSKNRGFLDAKTVAVGLSDFIAERAQEELNLTFFQGFKENLAQPSELTVLFPNTKNLLYQFEISNYKTLLANARESFTVDLDNLGLNFPKVLELDKYEDLYNSPEVYNLALIYSIADLAYREVPVEQIMIAGFRKLENRKVELGRSIDNQLAESILFPKKEAIEKTSKKLKEKVVRNNLPPILRGRELPTLQKYVEEYLAAVDASQEEIKQDFNAFHNLLTDETQKNIPIIRRQHLAESYTKFKTQLTKVTSTVNNNLVSSGSLLDNLNQRGELIYFNRRIKEDSILSFYRNTIAANLQQKEYFDYLLEDPAIEDYNLVFDSPSKTNDEIVSQGISQTRKLINENYGEILDDKLVKLKTYAADARTLKGELLRIEKENEGVYNKVADYVTRADLLKMAVEEEIEFWKKVTNKDKSDKNIAALYFLKALTEDDYYIKLFRDVLERSSDSESMERQITRSYFNTLGSQFQGTLNIGNERLDSIQFNLAKKTTQLTSQYGGKKINPKLYDQKATTYQSIEKMAAIDLQIDEAEKEFVQKRRAVENSVVEKMETDAEFETLQGNLEELNAQIDEINETAADENRELTEEEKETIRQLNQGKKTINNQLDALAKQYDDERNQLVNALELERDEKITMLLQEKENVKNPYVDFSSTLPLTSQDSFPRLNKIYALADNEFLKKYEEEKLRQTQIDSSQFAAFNQLDIKLEKETENLQQLQQKTKQLKNYLAALENEYCKDLVRAKVNAQNLSKGLELSTHILLAFRDYQDISKPITYSDTSRIVVTKNEVDLNKGFILGTATSDSLNVQDKIIIETAIDTTIARWVTWEKFDSLRRDPLEWNLFLGLMYQRLNAIEDAPNFSAQGTALLATKFFSIANDMENTRTKLSIKKANKLSKVTYKDYYPFIRSTVDLFNTIITTQSIGDSTLQDTYKSLTNIPQISNQALSLYENIYVKEYGNAIVNAMELLKIITDKKLTSKEQRQSTRATNAVLTYGTFMANMVNAQTSNQVKNIMRSATLPPGSSRIKRETTSSFTINSYLGVAIGRDRLLDVPANLDLAQDAFGASLSVPIGFTYSFSPNIIKNNSSFSIHVPLLDLGAITAYRQNPKNTNYRIDNLPDFSWSNLFSPGAFVVYNFANSPFSLGVGGQYGPQLREIKLDTGDAINVNSWRFPMAFFTIDVPFFNLYTGSRKIIVK